MRWPVALTIARRELRGGLSGFRVFIACLALGVAGIAGVGSVTAAIERGLAAEGRTILGGDVAVTYTYRPATAEERAWLDASGEVSEVFDLRSMIGKGTDRALAQVKAVDTAYPLYGEAEVDIGDFADAIAERDGVWGLVTEPVLAERLALRPGDRVRLGVAEFEYRGALVNEPDRAGGGFQLGPRLIVASAGLRAAGLLAEGSLFETVYRVRTALGADLAAMETGLAETFPDAGARWRDRANAAPGISRFVERLGAFLTLVGLAALVVGGVGVAAAVRGYLTKKVPTIAALRAVGASAGTVFTAYLAQIGVLAAIGVVAGIMLGGGTVALAGPIFADRLPIPASFAVYPWPLAVAALYGVLVAAIAALVPLAWLREVRPAVLFRGFGPKGGLPRRTMLAVLVALLAGLVAAVSLLSGAPVIALWVMGGIAAALLVLRAAGWLMAKAAWSLGHSRFVRRRPGLRLALAALGAPGAETVNVVMALGLGLGVLAGISQIDANMQRLITTQLPEGAPAFFFVDIQPDQLEPFRERLAATDGVESVETAPMLRGVVTHLNGVPATEAEVDPAGAWVLRGDRGVTYSDTPPEGSVLTEGTWWPADYTGPPLVSFAEEEGRELGLSIGSTITISVLGRPIQAEVANFRVVEWRGLGINFLIVLSPNALAGAPHTHLATVHAAEASEAPILRLTAEDYGNVTAVRIRDQITRVADALGNLGAATRWGAIAVLATGFAVLIGAAATAAEAQTREAALLKVLGAVRRRILMSFALRAGLLGLAAAVVALVWGSLAAWGVTRFLLDADFILRIWPAVWVLLGGMGLSLLTGLVFSLKPLRLRPATVLRQSAA
ncbi:MAG: FtsX-like permease family protein [Pseudomonadota bacterium]